MFAISSGRVDASQITKTAYSRLFEGLDVYDEHDEFWTKLFSTTVDFNLFMELSKKKSTKQFVELQPTWKMFLLAALDACSMDNDIMERNALDMLNVYFQSLFLWHASDSNFVFAFSDWDSIELFLERITFLIIKILKTHRDSSIRKKAFSLLNRLIVDSPADNIFNDYFIAKNELFVALLSFGLDPATSALGLKAMICLSLLMNYKRFETKNVIYAKLEKLDNQALCTKLASFFMENFWKARMAYECDRNKNKLKESDKERMSNFGISKERRYSMLLFYDCVYTNEYFTKILAFKHYENNPIFSVKAKGSGIKIGTAISEFVGMCNQIFSNSKDKLYSKLGVLTFNALLQNNRMRDYMITEEYHVNRSLIDLKIEKSSKSIISVMVESLCVLIRDNLGKSISIEVLLTSVECLLRILHALKESSTVLKIDWLKVWSCLMLLVKFIAVNHDALVNKSFELILTILKTFNFIISYGDSYLDSSKSYDEFYSLLIQHTRELNVLASMTNYDLLWRNIEIILNSKQNMEQLKLKQDNIVVSRYNEVPTQVAFQKLMYKTLRSTQIET